MDRINEALTDFEACTTNYYLEPKRDTWGDEMLSLLRAARRYVAERKEGFTLFKHYDLETRRDTVYLTLYYVGEELSKHVTPIRGKEGSQRAKIAFIVYTPGTYTFSRCYRKDVDNRAPVERVHF
jgi:hypothetical protein